MNQRNCLVARFVLLFAAVGISGCSDANVDLQRQILVLRDELERVKKEGAAQAAPPAAKEAQKTQSAGTADAQTLKSNYEVSGRTLRAALEKRLSDTQLENLTLFQPKFEPYPHRAELSLEFRSAGFKFTIDHIPVKASLDGAWVFPSVDSVLAQVEKLKSATLAERSSAPPSTPSPSRSGTRSGQADTNEVTAPAAASKTVVVGWESKGAGALPQTPPQNPSGNGGPRGGQATSTPQSPSSPAPIMPTQREVQIKF